MIRPKMELAKPNPEPNVSQLSKKFMIRNPENMNRNVLMDACHQMKLDCYNAKVCLPFFQLFVFNIFYRGCFSGTVRPRLMLLFGTKKSENRVKPKMH